MIKDDDLKLLSGFDDGQTDKQIDICDCRVAFAPKNYISRCLSDLIQSMIAYHV